jgi:hypothetical protein
MSLIHSSLAWFLLLGGVPVILHFLLKPKPKQLLFPALRLVKVRRQRNVERLRLRHIWLLLLRIAVIALLVFAVARLRVPAADYQPTTTELVTLIVIVVLAAITYFGLMTHWRRQKLPSHIIQYRRTYLRGGTALGTLLLAGLLVLWPFERRIAAAITQPDAPIGAHLPVSAVLLFDTSLSMQYRHESKTRLEIAQQIASEHAGKLPARSRLAVTDSTGANPILFQADISSALKRIGQLEVHPVSHALNDRVRAAIDFQLEDLARTLSADPNVPAERQQDPYLREIYIFTDLAASAWRHDETALLRQQLAQNPNIGVYVIDVGVEKPSNVGISGVKLSENVISQGSELIVQGTVEGTGEGESKPTVELWIENETGKLVKRGQSTVTLRGSEAGTAQFSVRGLQGPIRQGELRLIGSDPLPFDDVGYFTVEVQSPREVLVVSPARAEAQYWLEALAPEEMRKLGRTRWQCTWCTPGKLVGKDLRRYAAVCLIDVPRLPSDVWSGLTKYVEAGGGVMVALGPNADAVSYNSEAAQKLLPVELEGRTRFSPPEFLDLKNIEHPLLKKFGDWGTSELTAVEILRYWKVQPVAAASIIAGYTNSSAPALVDRVHGRGRVVLFTTSVSREGWNDLPASGWSFIAFADQTVRYLSRQVRSTFNYTAGEEVLVTLGGDESLENYILRKPSLQQLPGVAPAGKTSFVVREVDQLGQYRILDASPESQFEMGFSVNPPPLEDRLARMSAADLNDQLGEKRYSLARSTDDLDRRVRVGRLGQEAFGFVMFVLIVAFVLEHMTANRFYEETQRSGAA